MFIYLYGFDSYRARQKLNQYIVQYQEKFGPSLEQQKFFLNDKDSLEKLNNFLSVSGMFGSHKLAILENFSNKIKDKKKEKEIEEFLIGLRSSDLDKVVILFLDIFVSDSDDRKVKTTLTGSKKIINISEKIEEFNYFNSFNQAKNWIDEELKKYNSSIENRAAQLLFESFGRDTWRLAKELEKLSLYRLGESIRLEDLSQICVLENNVYIFNLFDSFFNRTREKTLFIFRQALDSGLEAQMIFNLFVDQIRTAVYLILNKNDLLIGSSPYKIKMIKNKLNNFKTGQIQKIFNVLADIDDAIKNGRTDFEFALEYIFLNF